MGSIRCAERRRPFSSYVPARQVQRKASVSRGHVSAGMFIPFPHSRVWTLFDRAGDGILVFGLQVRRLEAEGVPSKHAEVITSAITEVLNDSLENVAQSFVSKGEMQKVSCFEPFEILSSLFGVGCRAG